MAAETFRIEISITSRTTQPGVETPIENEWVTKQTKDTERLDQIN